MFKVANFCGKIKVPKFITIETDGTSIKMFLIRIPVGSNQIHSSCYPQFFCVAFSVKKILLGVKLQCDGLDWKVTLLLSEKAVITISYGSNNQFRF